MSMYKIVQMKDRKIDVQKYESGISIRQYR